MNTPIIDPMWFYYINVVDNLGIWAVIFSFVSVIVLIVCYIAYNDDDTLFSKGSIGRKIFVTSSILSPILFLISVLIPSKETMMQMMIASYVTKENVSMVSNEVKNSAEWSKKFVIDVVKEINNQKEDKK